MFGGRFSAIEKHFFQVIFFIRLSHQILDKKID